MKLGEIKIEALKMMGVNLSGDIYDSKAYEDNVNFNAYLANMPGSINRCFASIEEKRILPVLRTALNPEYMIKTDVVRFPLDSISDFFDIHALLNNSGICEFKREGNMIILPDDGDYQLLYYPSIPRIFSFTDNDTVLPIPDRICAYIPLYIKGDLYRLDDEREANEARNWWEQLTDEMKPSVTEQGKVKTVYGVDI